MSPFATHAVIFVLAGLLLLEAASLVDFAEALAIAAVSAGISATGLVVSAIITTRQNKPCRYCQLHRGDPDAEP